VGQPGTGSGEWTPPGSHQPGDQPPLLPPGYAAVPSSGTPYTYAYPPPTAPMPPDLDVGEAWFSRGELRFAGLIIAALAVVGALLGVAWKFWATTATRGLVYTGHAIVPDQTEGFISTDGRFAILTGITGVVAGGAIWLWRAHRGPIALAALGVGGVIGSLLTDLVGRALGGGKDTGTLNTVLPRLPLQVHAVGVLVLESLLALLVYIVCALFVSPDDLGRGKYLADYRGTGSTSGSTGQALVGARVELNQPGGDGHAPGSGDQRDLPTQ
jgi:hypothetical protein